MTPIIEFKNYTFKYRSQSEPTLREIDLTVNPGEKVLIVGTVRVGKIDSGALHQRDGSFFIPWRKQRNFDCGR